MILSLLTRCRVGRWLSLILCLALLTSSCPANVGATQALHPTERVGPSPALAAPADQDAEIAAAPLPLGTVLGLVVNADGERAARRRASRGRRRAG